jgi:hypothetical protein
MSHNQHQLLEREKEFQPFPEQASSVHATFPKVSTVFHPSVDHPNAFFYDHAVASLLKQFIQPDEFITDGEATRSIREIWQDFCSELPIFRWVVWDPESLNISIVLVMKFRLNAAKFFYDMIHHWLLPGKKVNVDMFFAIDFRLPDLNEQLYTLAEIVVHLTDATEYEQALRNLPILETEVRLGVTSIYHSAKILEIKGLAVDEKTALIQERIAFLLHYRPKEFDSDLFVQMQQFLVTVRPQFKAVREVSQMVRLIGYFYLMRQEIKQRIEQFPERRHLKLKIGTVRLHLPLGIKRVLGVFVAINFLKDNEVFEDAYLVQAIQRFVPSAILVVDSVFIEHVKEERILMLYLEIAKQEEAEFLSEEIRLLRQELGEELKRRVQQLTRPVFMPRNEEEVMKNIITLSQELRYLRDIPQVIISFDEHTDQDISFTVIMLRILLPHACSLQELFDKREIRYSFTIDRVKKVGTVWRKYPKEATVFRIRLPLHPFVRSDQSLDLFRARQAVLAEIQVMMGEVRDYNGGMISKQLEVFKQLQKELGKQGKEQELLLENFFHSIFPVEQRNLLDPLYIKNLFIMFSDVHGRAHPTEELELYHHEEEKLLYVIMVIKDHALKNKIVQAVAALNISPTLLPSVLIQMADKLYLGYLYFADLESRTLFLETLRECFDV